MVRSKSKLPDLSPGTRQSLSYGWENMKANFLAYFAIVIVVCLLDTPMGIFEDQDNTIDTTPFEVIFNFFIMVYTLLVIPPFSYASSFLFVQGVRKEKIEVKNIINGFDNYLNIVLANLLKIGLIGISLVALIIPGIIVACRLVFVAELMMDKQLDPIAAVETSWKMTRGHTGKVFRLGVASVFIIIVGFICFIVGIFPAVMWIKASFATLYQTILEEKGDDLLMEVDHPESDDSDEEIEEEG